VAGRKSREQALSWTRWWATSHPARSSRSVDAAHLDDGHLDVGFLAHLRARYGLPREMQIRSAPCPVVASGSSCCRCWSGMRRQGITVGVRVVASAMTVVLVHQRCHAAVSRSTGGDVPTCLRAAGQVAAGFSPYGAVRQFACLPDVGVVPRSVEPWPLLHVRHWWTLMELGALVAGVPGATVEAPQIPFPVLALAGPARVLRGHRVTPLAVYDRSPSGRGRCHRGGWDPPTWQ
jgi:hypothetical protein